MKKIVVFIMGATNCGKTTLINSLEEYYPVVVGKKLREMFPPEYFDGQAAPAKTDEIAFRLMVEGIDEAHQLGKIPLIDGQPRNQVQLGWCEANYFDNQLYDCKIMHLWAPRDIRVQRAEKRDKDDPSKLKLSMDRMDGDSIILYDLWLQLSMNYIDNMKVFNTSKEGYIDDIRRFIKS